MAKTMSFTRDMHIRESINSQLPINSQKFDKAEAKNSFIKKYLLSEVMNRLKKTLELCKILVENHNVYSTVVIYSAGFHYTGDGNTARCDQCGLEVSNWTLEKKPFTVHAERSPNCPFVRSLVPDNKIVPPLVPNYFQMESESMDYENPAKRQKVEATDEMPQRITLVEVDMMKEIRKRTFSHWPLRTPPSRTQMIEAGFFSCNVGDRVICIYCNLICQSWNQHTDDPWEIHRTLSPKCPLVVAKLQQQQTSSILIINESTNNGNTSTSNEIDPFRCHEIVYTAACHTAYIEIPRRLQSFATWPKENVPSPDDLIKAGFFYTGTNTVVTCFYCNGSLQNWGANDNPTIEHARWFPHCAYAKQLCGAELYRKIQESKRAQQERATQGDPNKRSRENFNGRGQLIIPDESTLSRFVAARLDIAISQHLLDQPFKLSIIKRCWEDQLRLKRDDFSDDCELLMACIILQKQIAHIDGKKENITVPNIAMQKLREREQQREMHTEEQAMDSSSSTMSTSSNSTKNDNDDTASERAKQQKDQKSTDGNLTSSSNSCLQCGKEEKRLACIPCGHLATCVNCGYSLRLCPVCRREIEAFVRVYL